MKKAVKIISYLFLSFITILIILVVVAALSENKIAKIAVEQIGKTTNVPVTLDDIDFSLVHDFPYATIKCRNFLVSSPVSNDIDKQDTLAFVGRLYVAVQTRKLIKGIFEIRKVEISDAKLFYNVDTAGLSNFDFLNDTTQQNVVDTSANNIFLDIKDFNIKNTVCYYRDKKMKAAADLMIEQLDLSGLINKDRYNGKAEGKTFLTNCSYDTTNLWLMKQAALDFEIKYDSSYLTVDKADIRIDEDAELSLSGTVDLRDTISADLILNAKKLDLANLSKYVPQNYFQKYEVHNLSGILTANATITGMITDSVMPAVNVDFDLTKGNVKYQDYPELSQISFKGSATNGKQRNNSTTSVNIKSLNFQTAKSKASFSGKVENLDHLKYNFNSTLDIDLDEVSPFVPDSLLHSITGKVNAVISTKGNLPDSISYKYINDVLANSKVSLKLTDVNTDIDSLTSAKQLSANIEYEPNQIFINHFRAGIHYDKVDLDSVNFEAKIIGNPLKYDSLDVQFNRFDAALKNSNVALTGTLKNPLYPDYLVSGKLTLDLAEIRKYFPDSLVNSLSGNVSATFESEAQLNLDSISSQINKLIFERSKFQIDFSNVNLKMPDSLTNIKELSGQMKYQSDSLWITQLEGNYLGTQFDMNSVSAINIYSAAVKNQKKELVIHGNFNAGYFDYAEIEKILNADSTTVEKPQGEPLNFTYKINGMLKANSLKYKDALYSNISSKFLVKENYYVFDSLSMDAFDGHALTSLKIEMRPENEITLFFKTDIRKMDITKLVKSFYQYIDYEDIKAENVRGIFSTKMDGEIVLKDYEPDYKSLMLKGDLTIEKGALFNVKPVMEIEKIKGVGLKSMDSLYFSTLNSSVFLFNNKLYIPKTEIRTTSFDAMFLGMYSFDEDYAYHIRMFLGEVLSSKSKSNLKKQMQDGGFTEEDESDVTKGRTSIYVVSKSENGKEKAGFDKKKDRQNMVAKVNLQKQMVDLSFHPALVKYDIDE